MSFDFGQSADRQRDAKLRRRLLEILQLARGYAPSGGLSGPRLMAMASESQPEDMGFTGDDHFVALCRDLEAHGVVQLVNLSRRKGELYGARHVALSITAKGTQLIEENIPPIAGIDDERIVS